MQNTFILKFTQGSLDKILKELNKDSITKQEFYKELQDNLNNSTIYGIYDYDVAELENIGKNTRQEVRIILKEYNIALCIKPKSYNTLEIFRSLDKDFTHIKNIESAKMLPYKFKVADEYIQGYLRAKELITELKTDFEIRLKEAEKKNKEIAGFMQNKIDITQAINKKDKKEMQKMQDKLKENTILFTNDIAKMIRYAFNYAKKAIYIQSPWIKYDAINALKKELETSLQNDVKIYIQCGIKDARDETKSDIIDEDSKQYIR